MRFFILCVACLLQAGPLHADELISKAQRELRARKYFLGSVDGRPSDALTAAIKKFQTAKGIDATTGALDDETMRALGLPNEPSKAGSEAAISEACTDCLIRYFRAREAGEWKTEERFYAGVVDYFDDGAVDRSFIQKVHGREYRRWPNRRYILLNRIVSRIPDSPREARVTVRVRQEFADSAGASDSMTEDLRFVLRLINGEWRITAVGLAPIVQPSRTEKQ